MAAMKIGNVAVPQSPPAAEAAPPPGAANVDPGARLATMGARDEFVVAKERSPLPDVQVMKKPLPFDPPRWPRFPPPPPGVTMNRSDLLISRDLANRIEPFGGLRGTPKGPKTFPVTLKDGDVVRGPEGQPLASLRLPSGRTAFVDPNTNRYYLTDQGAFAANSTVMTWQIDLPSDTKFTNSHFSDADVRYIQQLARPSRGPWPLPPPPPPGGGGWSVDSLQSPPRPPGPAAGEG